MNTGLHVFKGRQMQNNGHAVIRGTCEHVQVGVIAGNAGLPRCFASRKHPSDPRLRRLIRPTASEHRERTPRHVEANVPAPRRRSVQAAQRRNRRITASEHRERTPRHVKANVPAPRRRSVQAAQRRKRCITASEHRERTPRHVEANVPAPRRRSVQAAQRRNRRTLRRTLQATGNDSRPGSRFVCSSTHTGTGHS
jgi:hypothetical protein